MAESKPKRDPANIIQFRAESSLVTQLSAVAERLHTPIGVLARQWVAERLAFELSKNLSVTQNWRNARLVEIIRKAKVDMEAGPLQILHICPLTEAQIDATEAEKVVNLMAPLGRAEGHIGRINRLGYFTENSYKEQAAKKKGYVQLFRTGQIESVRILPEDAHTKALFGDNIDSDLIDAVWMYCCALHALKVPLPLIVSTTFVGVDGYRIRTRSYNAPTGLIDEESFSASEIEINDWSGLKPHVMALLMKPILDELWNAAGFAHSMSYDASGAWRGFLQ
jgi:hypothetical protein